MHERNTSAVSVILPAFNEEAAIAPLIAEIASALSAHALTHEIIVVDDASTDRTAWEASRAGARVLRHPQNRGYGAAVKTGIMAAEHDTNVIIDADGTYPPDEIPALVSKLEAADMVVGSRTGEFVREPLLRRPAKWILRWIAMRVAGTKIPDLNSGMRAFRRECVLQYFPILSNQFSFTTTVTLALLADDYHVIYHPINYYPRIGKSKIVPWHLMDFMTLILRMSMMFQPLRVFTPLGISCGALGVIKAVYDIVTLFARSTERGLALLYQPVLSTSAVLLVLVGLQLLLIGMVADGVVRRIAQHNRPQAPSHASFDQHIPYGVSIEEEIIAKHG